jgi:hypothetical protein
MKNTPRTLGVKHVQTNILNSKAKISQGLSAIFDNIL